LFERELGLLATFFRAPHEAVMDLCGACAREGFGQESRLIVATDTLVGVMKRNWNKNGIPKLLFQFRMNYEEAFNKNISE
jgi:hypothetical protein